ncbi:hypothetical protein K4L06_03035 [Lysobacter sp. BMK333-48F3]|uniref:hypothetical protein n=1 Tax=Lysobacter sp. BMK333-48F3 TaxID=2867962 RepID=UPI001C8BEEC3|nr:hypothetical protein [Lysobacter sp. BMK333-48F3]MBX9400269.1 hypothetical protein [Lysobacter sp. BMK333-48F3]
MAESKRQQPMQAKYFLARAALTDTAWFVQTFGSEDGDQALQEFWHLLAQDMPPEARVEPQGLSARRAALPDGAPAVVISFPPPERNEAHYLAAVATQEGVRVFCLEKSICVADRSEITMIAEFASNGRANWGTGPRAAVADFLQAIARIVADSDLRPMSFIEIPLA